MCYVKILLYAIYCGVDDILTFLVRPVERLFPLVPAPNVMGPDFLPAELYYCIAYPMPAGWRRWSAVLTFDRSMVSWTRKKEMLRSHALSCEYVAQCTPHPEWSEDVAAEHHAQLAVYWLRLADTYNGKLELVKALEALGVKINQNDLFTQ